MTFLSMTMFYSSLNPYFTGTDFLSIEIFLVTHSPCLNPYFTGTDFLRLLTTNNYLLWQLVLILILLELTF